MKALFPSKLPSKIVHLKSNLKNPFLKIFLCVGHVLSPTICIFVKTVLYLHLSFILLATWLNHSFIFLKIYHSHSEKIIAKSL